MSRIGKLPVKIPAGVTITVDSGVINVTGPKGSLSRVKLPETDVKIDGDCLTVSRRNEEKLAKSQHGLMRSLINNMVIGVTDGFSKKLEVNGVGFKAALAGSDLNMSLGFSHPTKYHIPDGVTAQVEVGS